LSAPHENPALGSFGEGDARVIIGKRYRTRIRGIVSASIVFDELEEGRLRYRMHALGSTERGAWSWSSLGPERTRVTHVFDHHGFLINLMSAAFEQVPNWRLGRLAAEVARRARGAAG
jgi:hypothetical protein